MFKRLAIVGVALGDEAKARVTNWLNTQNTGYCIRYSGSSNAGHTLYYNNKKIVRNYIPSTDFSNPNNYAYLGSDMVINPEELLEEIKKNLEFFPNLASHLIIDSNAFVITKEHLEKDKENVKTIGSVGKGVTPCYVSKVNRNGIKLSQLLKDNNPTILAIKELGVKFKYVTEMFNEFEKTNLIFEGAQSIILDYHYGSHPFVTSGSCGLNGILNSGFAKFMPTKVYGINKCYLSKVGLGNNMPTIINNEIADHIRTIGAEFGSVSGRSRNIGWLDLPMMKYSCDMSGVTNLVLTKFDVLNGMKTIKVCTSYDKPLRCADDLNTAKPIYTEIPGWVDSKDISQLKPFIDLVENTVGLKVKYISQGVNPEDMIEL